MPNSKTYTEEELIQAIRNKDTEAFLYLYDKYSNALFSLILSIVKSEENSKDLLQDVFYKIWKNFDLYNSEKGRLYTWMLNVARNAAIDKIGNKKYIQHQKNQDIENFVNVFSNKHSIQVELDHIGMKEVLNQIPEDYKRIIEMAYFGGFTQEEIAQELKIPLGTVKTRTRAAFIMLRKIFGVNEF